MAEASRCAECDKPEQPAACPDLQIFRGTYVGAAGRCERYCSLCQSQFGIRLCSDGVYYCPDCREACEAQLADGSRP